MPGNIYRGRQDGGGGIGSAAEWTTGINIAGIDLEAFRALSPADRLTYIAANDSTELLADAIIANNYDPLFIPPGEYIVSNLQKFIDRMPKLACSPRGVKFYYLAYESILDFEPPVAEILGSKQSVSAISSAGVNTSIDDDGVNSSDFHTFLAVADVTGYAPEKLIHISARVGIPKEATPNPITGISVDGGTGRVTLTFLNAITSSDYANGSVITLYNITRPTNGNNNSFTIADLNTGAKTLVLKDIAGAYIDGTTWETYLGGGTWKLASQPQFTFTVNTGTEEVTATGHPFSASGQGTVQVETTSSLPAPLTAGTTYWPIFVDANTLKLATSKANAIAGTAINITTAGSGTHTLTVRTCGGTLNAITKATPGVATTDFAPLAGQEVIIDGVYGMLEVNRNRVITANIAGAGPYTFEMKQPNVDGSSTNWNTSSFGTYRVSGFAVPSENWVGEGGLVSNVDAVANRIYLVNKLQYEELYTTSCEVSVYTEEHQGFIVGFPMAQALDDPEDVSIRYAPAAWEIHGVPRLYAEVVGKDIYGPLIRQRSCPLAEIDAYLENSGNRARAAVSNSNKSVTAISNANPCVVTLSSAMTAVLLSDYDIGKMVTIRISETSPYLNERTLISERVDSTHIRLRDIHTGAYFDTSDVAHWGTYTSGDATLYTNSSEKKMTASQAFTADSTTDIVTCTAHKFTASGQGPFVVTNSGGGLPGGLAINTAYWAIYIDADTMKFATSQANALAGTAVDISSNGTGTNTITGLYKKSFDTANNVVYWGATNHGLSAGSTSYYLHCDPTGPAAALNNRFVFIDTAVTGIANAITGSGNYAAATAFIMRDSEGNAITLPAGYTGDVYISATDNSGSLTYTHSAHGPEFYGRFKIGGTYGRHNGGTSDGSSLAWATATQYKRGYPTYCIYSQSATMAAEGPGIVEEHEEGGAIVRVNGVGWYGQKGAEGATYDGWAVGQNRNFYSTARYMFGEGGTYGLRSTGQFQHHKRPMRYWHDIEIRNLRHPSDGDKGFIFERTDSANVYHRPIVFMTGTNRVEGVSLPVHIETGADVRARGSTLIVANPGAQIFNFKSRNSGMAEFGKVVVDYRGDKNNASYKPLILADADNCWFLADDVKLILREDDDLHATSSGSLIDLSLTNQQRFHFEIKKLTVHNPAKRTIPKLCDAVDYPFIDFLSYGPDLIELPIVDETTPLSAIGTGVKCRRRMNRYFMPTNYLLYSGNAPVTTIPIVDVRKNAVSLFGTNKLQIDLTENTSKTAANQVTISNLSLTCFVPGDIIDANVTQVDGDAAGLKVYIQGFYLN